MKNHRGWRHYAYGRDINSAISFGIAASGTPIMIDYEYDGTAESYWFINGTLMTYAAFAPSKTNNDPSFFGWNGQPLAITGPAGCTAARRTTPCSRLLICTLTTPQRAFRN